MTTLWKEVVLTDEEKFQSRLAIFGAAVMGDDWDASVRVAEDGFWPKFFIPLQPSNMVLWDSPDGYLYFVILHRLRYLG